MVIPAQYRARSRHSLLHRSAPLLFSLTSFSLAFLSGGCITFFHRRPNIPWATAVQVHPTLQSHAANGDGAGDLDAPEIGLDLAPLVAVMAPIRSAPPRPKVNPPPAPAATAPAADSEKGKALGNPRSRQAIAQVLGSAFIDDWRVMYVNKEAIDLAAEALMAQGELVGDEIGGLLDSVGLRTPTEGDPYPQEIPLPPVLEPLKIEAEQTA